MTGCVILFEDVNIVVVEGCPKQQKRYKWEEDMYGQGGIEN
jgi:hypothetical protein